jgi:hypothetical protein
MKRFIYLAAALSAMSLALTTGAGASSYPDRPIDASLGAGATRSSDLAPDDRPRHMPSASGGVRIGDIAPDDRVLHRPGSDVTITPVVQRAAVADSFDWVDAGIGAAGMAGLALLGIGAALVLRRRQAPAFS